MSKEVKKRVIFRSKFLLVIAAFTIALIIFTRMVMIYLPRFAASEEAWKLTDKTMKLSDKIMDYVNTNYKSALHYLRGETEVVEWLKWFAEYNSHDLLEMPNRIKPPNCYKKPYDYLFVACWVDVNGIKTAKFIESLRSGKYGCTVKWIEAGRNISNIEEKIIRLYKSGTEPWLIPEMAYALGKIGSNKSVPILIDIATDFNLEYAERSEAIVSLGDLRSSAAVQPLSNIAVSESEEQDLRDTAIINLGRIGDVNAIPAVKQYLQGRNIDEIGKKIAQEVLIKLEANSEIKN